MYSNYKHTYACAVGYQGAWALACVSVVTLQLDKLIKVFQAQRPLSAYVHTYV